MGEPLRHVWGTPLQINNIDLLFWWIDVSIIDAWRPFDPSFFWHINMGPDGSSSVSSWGITGVVHIHLVCWYTHFVLHCGWGCSSACWVMGTAWARHSHTPQSGFSPALMSLAGAVSGSCCARTNCGRGHGKWGDGSAELCYHWHSDWRVCVCVCMCVCVCLSLDWTDWRTADPPAVCMTCPILHPATLCKQQLSGPEESRRQEVSSSLYEQGRGERDSRWWCVWVTLKTELYDHAL